MDTLRSRLGLFFSLLALGLLIALAVRLVPSASLLQARERARQAWEIRHAPGLEEALEHLQDPHEAEAALIRARRAYLQGRFLGCLDLLAGDPGQDQQGWESLREQAWEALALEVPWPGTVLSWERLGPEDLVRVVDDGGAEGLFLEAFGLRQGHHGPLALELRRPDGTRLREDRPWRWPLGPSVRLQALKLEATDFMRLEHLRQGRPTLDLGTRAPGGLVVFRFQGAIPPTVEGAVVRVPAAGGQDARRWRWEEGSFRRLD